MLNEMHFLIVMNWVWTNHNDYVKNILTKKDRRSICLFRRYQIPELDYVAFYKDENERGMLFKNVKQYRLHYTPTWI